MKMNPNYLLLGVISLFLVSILDVHTVNAQDDDDFDDGVVSEEVDAMEAEPLDYTSPVVSPSKYYFAEHFDDADKVKARWIMSMAKKDGADEQIAKYDGEWQVEQPSRPILKGDLGLVLKSKVKHAAISARLNRPFVFSDKPFVVQYEVTLQEGQECGGSYIKLISSGKESTDLKQFHDKTPYTIMFGPDKCGNDHKLHFIFRHRNPKNGTLEEKHCKKPNDRMEEPFKDKRPHLYTLILKPDNSFSVLLDNKEINSGSLLEDFTPAVNPPEEIDDPSDKKPSDWDDRERIPDPTASKPEDWDESAPPQIPDPQAVRPDGWLDDEPDMIPDSTGEKPEDWDVEMDGEWEAPLIENPQCANAPGCGKWNAPLISNPEYKGVWRAPLIPNPQYQGKWAPKKIPNPYFFHDDHPFKMTSIAAVGFELWSMSSSILFDNIVVTDSVEQARAWAAQTFDLKVSKLDKESDSAWTWLVKTTDQNPWLWAVYVLIIALLTGLFIFMCCFPSQEKEDMEKAAEKKKTDDIADEAREEVEGEGEAEAEVEAEAEEDSNVDNEDASQDEEEDSQPSTKQDLEEPLPETKADAETTEGGGDILRKRKPRKE